MLIVRHVHSINLNDSKSVDENKSSFILFR